MRYRKNTKPRFSGNAPNHQLRKLAHELRGEIGGPNWILAPAPGASDADRSLKIALSASAPDGFTIISRLASRDDARAYVAAALNRVRNGRRTPDLFGVAGA